MQSINELLKKIPTKRTYEEVKAEILADIDIQMWLDEKKDVIDDEIIERSISSLNEFVRNKDRSQEKPVLKLYADNIYVTYLPRDPSFELKYRDKVPSRLIYDRSTEKYKGVTLKDYQTDMNNLKFYEYCQDFIEIYRYGDRSKGMWLHGAFGVGKTYLMAGLATELHKRQVGVNFVSASQLMDEAYRILRSNEDNLAKKIETLSKSEVLIIDDLGTENPTNFMLKNVLYPIIKYRGEYNKPTFITSNLSKDEYYIQLNSNKDIIRKDIARLKEQLDVLTIELNITGKNRREKA